MLINGLCAASPAGSWRHPCLDIADAQPCSGNCSYWGTDEYQATLDANPDIITIMLGTNDVRCVAETACATPTINQAHTRKHAHIQARMHLHARTHARTQHTCLRHCSRHRRRACCCSCSVQVPHSGATPIHKHARCLTPLFTLTRSSCRGLMLRPTAGCWLDIYTNYHLHDVAHRP
jgi:hypothetical protein